MATTTSFYIASRVADTYVADMYVTAARAAETKYRIYPKCVVAFLTESHTYVHI